MTSDPARGDSSRRDRVAAYVRAHPGAYFSQIQRELGLAQGEAAYHLRVLEKEGSVSSVRSARYKHYFPRGALPPLDRETLMVLALAQPRAILLHVMHAPQITSRELAARLGTTEPNLAWHMKRLRVAGLVETTKSDGASHHTLLIDPSLLQRLLEAYHPAVWQVWVARFAETWTKLSTR